MSNSMSSGKTSGTHYTTLVDNSSQVSELEKKSEKGTILDRISALKAKIELLKQAGIESEALKPILNHLHNAVKYLQTAKQATTKAAQTKQFHQSMHQVNLAEKQASTIEQKKLHKRRLEEIQAKADTHLAQFKQLHAKMNMANLPFINQPRSMADYNEATRNTRGHSFWGSFKNVLKDLLSMISSKEDTTAAKRIKGLTRGVYKAYNATKIINAYMHERSQSITSVQNRSYRQIFHGNRSVINQLHKLLNSQAYDTEPNNKAEYQKLRQELENWNKVNSEFGEMLGIQQAEIWDFQLDSLELRLEEAKSDMLPELLRESSNISAHIERLLHDPLLDSESRMILEEAYKDDRLRTDLLMLQINDRIRMSK